MAAASSTATLPPSNSLLSAPAKRPGRDGHAVFPGDIIGNVDEFDTVVLGGGVLRESGVLWATRAGFVR